MVFGWIVVVVVVLAVVELSVGGESAGALFRLNDGIELNESFRFERSISLTFNRVES